MESPPSNMADLVVNAEAEVFPEDVGFVPTNSSFKINTSLLDPDTYYQVRMVALDQNSAITHEGYADCPLLVSLGGCSEITICFGPVAIDPIGSGGPRQLLHGRHVQRPGPVVAGIGWETH